MAPKTSSAQLRRLAWLYNGKPGLEPGWSQRYRAFYPLMGQVISLDIRSYERQESACFPEPFSLSIFDVPIVAKGCIVTGIAI